MPAPLYFRSDTSLEHETGPHPEGPGRIPAIEDELERRAWLGFERVEAPAVDLGVLRAVHPATYIDSVRFMSEQGGGSFDADTPASPGSYEAALHSCGGAVALVEALVSGDARTGFSGLRPPGHHAEPHTAMGFCLFSNVAVAAQHALDSLGLDRVFVLDWDVHHGNGTNAVFEDSSSVLFASMHQWPLYPGTGRLGDVGTGDGEGYSLNLPVPSGSGDATWLPLIEHVVVPAVRSFDPQLILISAGFDAHAADPLASCSLSEHSFAEMARQMVDLGRAVDAPVGAVLEGGYDLGALARSTAATLEVLADPAAVPSSHPADEVTRKAVEVYSKYWPVSA
jgi:acetoin utilization deacetylase AcuC-like enzyme